MIPTMTVHATPAKTGFLPVSDISHVPLDRWLPSTRFQSREDFPDDDLQKLLGDMKRRGQLQPAGGRPHPTKPGYIEGAWGHRRHIALVMGGWTKTIECKIKPFTDLEMAEIGLAENVQRATLTPYEEAQGLMILTRELEAHQIEATHEELAKRIGKTAAFISQTLAILNMPEEFQEVGRRHRLVKRSLYTIHTQAPVEAQSGLLELVDSGASFRAVSAAVTQAVTQAKAVKESSAMGADRQTASRATSVAQGGHGTMSRGQRVTGPSHKDALEQFNHYSRLLEEWIPLMSDRDFKRAAEPFARQILRGDLSRP